MARAPCFAHVKADPSLRPTLPCCSGSRTGIPTVDAFDAHVADFAQFRISAADYIRRLYIGHYSPAGIQFFAFALKKAVVEWLEPKPIAYQTSGTIIDFQDGRYLDKPPGNVTPRR